jgi:hypothetical protein
MSRTVPASILTALAQTNVEVYYAVEILFAAGPVRLWTGYGTRVIDGQNYIGAGELLSISGLEEVADLSAKSITIALSGAVTDLVSLALQEPYQRRPCRVLFGVIGSTDFVQVFSGSLNTMTIADSAETSSIQVLVDSRLVELDKSSNRRYTAESHRSRFSTDTFFDYVASLQDTQVAWGQENS